MIAGCRGPLKILCILRVLRECRMQGVLKEARNLWILMMLREYSMQRYLGC